MPVQRIWGDIEQMRYLCSGFGVISVILSALASKCDACAADFE